MCPYVYIHTYKPTHTPAYAQMYIYMLVWTARSVKRLYGRFILNYSVYWNGSLKLTWCKHLICEAKFSVSSTKIYSKNCFMKHYWHLSDTGIYNSLSRHSIREVNNKVTIVLLFSPLFFFILFYAFINFSQRVGKKKKNLDLQFCFLRLNRNKYYSDNSSNPGIRDFEIGSDFTLSYNNILISEFGGAALKGRRGKKWCWLLLQEYLWGVWCLEKKK